MDANTKNALGAQGLDVPDATKQLADVLAMDADIAGGAERTMKSGSEVSDIDAKTAKTGTEIGQAQATGDLPVADVLAKELGGQKSTEKVVDNYSRNDAIDKTFTTQSFDENGKLKANVYYTSGEYDYHYETNSAGCIVKVSTGKEGLQYNPGAPPNLSAIRCPA